MNKRLSAPFIGVTLVAGAVWVAMQSYNQHFSGPALNEAEQAQIKVQLLSFPRQLPTLAAPIAGEWSLVRLQPGFCDAICQGNMSQSKTLGVAVITPQDPSYTDIEQTLSTANYSIHQGKALLINPEGEFAGSLQPPYSEQRITAALTKLNN